MSLPYFKTTDWTVTLRWDDPPEGQAPLEAHGSGPTPYMAMDAAEANAKIEVARMNERIRKQLERRTRREPSISIDDIAKLL